MFNAVPENIITCTSPQPKGLEFPRGRGFCKTKTFKEIYEALLEFPEGFFGGVGVVGKGVTEKTPSVREVWIFSGTAQFVISCV